MARFALAAVLLLAAPGEDGDLVGTTFPEPVADGARATIVRWWTDTCPYCAASLPALETLREAYADDGLRVVGVYHPKPPREVDEERVLASAERLGFGGEVEIDADWARLERAWLSTGERRATSVTFLLDADGVVRFVHPGPSLWPSDDPDEAEIDAAFRALEAALRDLLED